jgi:hypothetical protein
MAASTPVQVVGAAHSIHGLGEALQATENANRAIGEGDGRDIQLRVATMIGVPAEDGAGGSWGRATTATVIGNAVAGCIVNPAEGLSKGRFPSSWWADEADDAPSAFCTGCRFLFLNRKAEWKERVVQLLLRQAYFLFIAFIRNY